MGNTSKNTFVDNKSENAVYEHPSKKYAIHRIPVGRGFKIKLVSGGNIPRELRGVFIQQARAISCIEAYEERLKVARPSVARLQEKAAARKDPDFIGPVVLETPDEAPSEPKYEDKVAE